MTSYEEHAREYCCYCQSAEPLSALDFSFATVTKALLFSAYGGRRQKLGSLVPDLGHGETWSLGNVQPSKRRAPSLLHLRSGGFFVTIVRSMNEIHARLVSPTWQNDVFFPHEVFEDSRSKIDVFKQQHARHQYRINIYSIHTQNKLAILKPAIESTQLIFSTTFFKQSTEHLPKSLKMQPASKNFEDVVNVKNNASGKASTGLCTIM